MKASFLLLSAALAASPACWFQAKADIPATGFTKVSADFMFDSKTEKRSGYYAATQFALTNGEAHYFGLQPRDGDTNRITYLVFGPGTWVADTSRCSPGADGGEGVSCKLEYPWRFDTWYRIELELVATEGGRHRWVGTLVEPDGTRVYIALFYTSAGGLTGRAAQWLEYYKYNGDKKTPETRGCQSYGKVFFKRPRFQGGGSHNYTGIINLEVFDQCAVAANTPNNRGGFTHKGVYFEGGFLPHPK